MPLTHTNDSSEPPGSEPRTLLVVDDERDILESVRLTFEGAKPPLRVLTATSGHEGLDLLGREPVDAVISDWRMPGMDGLSFLRQAKRVAPDVPRFLLTAFPHRNVASRAVHEAGIHAYLVKPVDPDDLVKAVVGAITGSGAPMDIKRVDRIFPSEPGSE